MSLFKAGEVMCLNVENKAIPFRNAEGIQDIVITHYSSNPKEQVSGNFYYYFNMIARVKSGQKIAHNDKTSDGKPVDYEKVKLIIVDSVTEMFEMMLAYHKKIFQGKDLRQIYGNFQEEVKAFWTKSNAFPIPKVFLALPKEVQDETGLIERRADIPGQALNGKVESKYTVALHCLPDRYAKTAKERYRFLTNTIQGYSAKTPMDMFSDDELYIPNDLNFVLERILSYYNKTLDDQYRFPDILVTGASGSGKSTSMRNLVCSP